MLCRTSFPVDHQFFCVARYVVEQAQLPNIKVRLVRLITELRFIGNFIFFAIVFLLLYLHRDLSFIVFASSIIHYFVTQIYWLYFAHGNS